MANKTSGGALRIGAVAYDPKVVTIWEGFKEYFAARRVPIDYVLYSTYDAQVEANLSGAVDVAWNSPLAWVKSQTMSGGACRAVAMRDSDRDLTTKIIVGDRGEVKTLQDLKGKKIAVGASDSPQATLIPLETIAEAGLEPGIDCRVIYHNVMVGKHGDHVGGERDAARALAEGRADAACVLDGNYSLFINEGTLDPGTTRVLTSTPQFDHCNFTVPAGVAMEGVQEFVEVLLAMKYEDPAIRPYMEMEGLKRWLPGRTTGYVPLERAVRRFQYYGEAASSAGN